MNYFLYPEKKTKISSSQQNAAAQLASILMYKVEQLNTICLVDYLERWSRLVKPSVQVEQDFSLVSHQTAVFW